MGRGELVASFPHPLPLTGNLLLVTQKNGKIHYNTQAWAYCQSRIALSLSCPDLLHF